MTLLDELRADGAKRSSCAACDWLDSRSPDERAEWQQAMSDKSISAPTIWRAMVKRGFTLTDYAVKRHRSNEHR